MYCMPGTTALVTSEGAVRTMAIHELSALLWRERELLDVLTFKLEEEQLLLTSGKSRWLPHGTREVEQVLGHLAQASLARTIEAAVVAEVWGLPTDASLAELAAAAPEGAWAEILTAHLDRTDPPDRPHQGTARLQRAVPAHRRPLHPGVAGRSASRGAAPTTHTARPGTPPAPASSTSNSKEATMSTFGALNTAYRGLTAAQQGMNVAGQNIANAATEGYTRQRVDQSSLAAPARGLFSGGALQPGQGVSVNAISRLGSSFLDAGVRSAGAQAGYATVRSSALQGIEGILQEPGDNGISNALQGFWSAWQGAANQPTESGPKGLLLTAANSVTDKISSAYKALDSQWSGVRSEAQDAVTAVNAAAAQVASYNTTIRSTLAAGGSANELIDARAKLTDQIAGLAGGTVREQPDGTVDVLVGGNALVTGGSVRTLKLAGATAMADAGYGRPARRMDQPRRHGSPRRRRTRRRTLRAGTRLPEDPEAPSPRQPSRTTGSRPPSPRRSTPSIGTESPARAQPTSTSSPPAPAPPR